jgi:hypothetical protein
VSSLSDQRTRGGLKYIMDNLFTDTFPVLVAFENLDMVESQQRRRPFTGPFTELYIFQQGPAILVLLLIWEDE